MKNILIYLYAMIVGNWKTTVAGVLIAGVTQLLASWGVVLTSSQADAISVIVIAVGALLPSPMNIPPLLKSFIVFILCGFAVAQFSACAVVKAVGCDNISAITAQAVQYACMSGTASMKTQSLGAAAESHYVAVLQGDTVRYSVFDSDGQAVVNWITSSGRTGSMTVAR